MLSARCQRYNRSPCATANRQTGYVDKKSHRILQGSHKQLGTQPGVGDVSQMYMRDSCC
jgi:hypothetical protein